MEGRELRRLENLCGRYRDCLLCTPVYNYTSRRRYSVDSPFVRVVVAAVELEGSLGELLELVDERSLLVLAAALRLDDRPVVGRLGEAPHEV